VLVAAATGWLAYSHTGGERVVVWREVSRSLRGVSFPKRRFDVYRDGAAFEQRFGRAASVDFGRRELVLVAMGPRSSTGYDLRIAGVIERRRSIVVVARERAPALGERVAPRLTFPYRLISIPRSDKSIRLELEGRP
jgi:hypothetical protein